MNWRRPWPWLALVGLVGAAIVAERLHRHELQRQADSLRAEQWRAKKDYAAATVACSLSFARGGVLRVEAYDEVFRRHGMQPELAGGQDDSEGETWAEFHDLGGEAGAWLEQPFADLEHPLVRQRLRSLWYRERSDESAQLAIWPLLQAEDAGWRLRVAWIATPHGIARVAPPADIAQRPLRTSTRLAQWQRLEAGGDEGEWRWSALEGEGHPQSEEWREALRKLERDWGHDPAQLAEWRERFQREHAHFHLVEAARDLGDGQVLVLRRFGPIQGATTLARSMDEIAAMAASLRCAPK